MLRRMRKTSTIVVALASVALAVVPAIARTVRPGHGETTIHVSPSGGDDTAQLQAALDECASVESSCSIRLAAGTFHTSQLVGNNLRGAVRGAGMHRTVIEALMARPMPDNWSRSPITPDNPWPGIMAFVDSDVTVSDLSISFPTSPLAPEYDLTGWGGSFFISDYFTAIAFTGEESNGRVRRVHVRGGPGTAFGFNVVAAFSFQPSVLKDPDEPPPLGHFFYKSLRGSFTVTESSCDTVETCVGTFGAADAKISISRNTIESGEFAFFMEPAMEHADVEFSRNVVRNTTIGGAFATHESRTDRGATRLRITNNYFEMSDPAEGLFLADFSVSPSLDLEVVDNRFRIEGIQVGAVDLRFVANARVSRNMIKGASAFGVYSASSSGEIRENHIRGAGVGVWLDGSSHIAVAKNRVRDAATWGIALQNGSTDNSVSRNVITDSGEYDLLWDETGDGNQWSRNRCERSSPAGLCEP